MKHATRIYPLLLKLYPSAYREAFGDQMVQALIDQCADIEASEGRVGLCFWLFALADEVKNICRQHWEARADRNGAGGDAAARWVMSAVLFVPLYTVFYAALVKAALALPHSPLSGPGVVIALAGLVLIPGVLSLAASCVLANAATRMVRNARQRRVPTS